MDYTVSHSTVICWNSNLQMTVFGDKVSENKVKWGCKDGETLSPVFLPCSACTKLPLVGITLIGTDWTIRQPYQSWLLDRSLFVGVDTPHIWVTEHHPWFPSLFPIYIYRKYIYFLYISYIYIYIGI